MGIEGKRDLRTQAALKLLGNPYASLCLEDEEVIPALKASPTLDQKKRYLRSLQNPYAYHSIFESEESSATVPLVKAPKSKGISKSYFRDNCRRVLSQYVSSIEGNILRPEFRDFIARNEGLTPVQRERVLKELEKYDLHSNGNFKPHFNRESGSISDDKLKKIEIAAKNMPEIL